MSETKQYDVVICGGGMVGMSLAVGLGRQGVSVALIERGAMSSQLDTHFDGRVSAIAQGSKQILDGIGAWADMLPHAEPILDIRVSDGASPIFLHYDHNEVGEDPFGYIVENRYIRNALHLALASHKNISLMEKTTISSFAADDNGVTVSTKEHGDIRCRLLVGADGKTSHIRKLANIKSMEWNYGQTAIVCTIEHDKPHNGLAQERFLPAGPFAVLPMQANRSSLVWVEPNDRVSIYMELPDEEFVQEIQERVGDYLGMLRVSGKRFTYPLSLMHAKNYTAKRLALIGDAAHGMHPIAGQGVNLGFRDVDILISLITERFKLGLDIADAATLAEYERWRRFDNVAMLAATDLLNRLFTNNIIPIKMARDMGLWAVGKMPPLKRFFMRHAMGLTGDRPAASHKK